MDTKTNFQVISSDDNLQFKFSNKIYTIKNLPATFQTKILVFIKIDYEEKTHIDNINLVSSNVREKFIDRLVKKFNLDYPDSVIIENELVQILEYIVNFLENKQKQTNQNKVVELSDKEKQEAIKYATIGKPYLDKVVDDMTKMGFVGEDFNKKLGVLVSISRKLDNPLSLIIKSRSSAGKTKLLSMICELTPDEDLKRITRLTPQSLYYNDKDALKHKLLTIEEQSGVEGADYVIRSLQSTNVLTQISTIKDPNTGRLKTIEHTVEGPLSLIFTTTNLFLNFENMNRCLITSMNETSAQTDKIQDQIGYLKTLDGYLKTNDNQQLKLIHQNFQRTLKPMKVFNPYSPFIKFPSKQLHVRRLRNIFEGLMEVIAFINQHKKIIKSKVIKKNKKIEYIEVDIEDIQQASDLMKKVFNQSLGDTSKTTEDLVRFIENMIQDKVKSKTIDFETFEFTRKELREYTGWNDYQLRMHLKELVNLEYLEAKNGKQGKKFLYQVNSFKFTKFNTFFDKMLVELKKINLKMKKTS